MQPAFPIDLGAVAYSVAVTHFHGEDSSFAVRFADRLPVHADGGVTLRFDAGDARPLREKVVQPALSVPLLVGIQPNVAVWTSTRASVPSSLAVWESTR